MTETIELDIESDKSLLNQLSDQLPDQYADRVIAEMFGTMISAGVMAKKAQEQGVDPFSPEVLGAIKGPERPQ